MSWTARQTVDGATYYIDVTNGQIALHNPGKGSRDRSVEKWCWIEDEAEGWIAAKCEGSTQVLINNKKVPIGEKRTLPLERSNLDLPEEDDLVYLFEITEPVVNHTLRRRFTELKTPDGKPNTTGFYTSVGTILIAINPYQFHPIYTAEHVKKYRSPGNQRLPPHVFQVAAAAHTALSLEHKSQAILISGESGAGKTEATKHCLSFFAEVSGSDSQLEVQVLSATPVLEAFGNAKTVRNNNSSRFGRWIEVHFDHTGVIASARIEQYLLEKARVVNQAEDERGYHIFYSLCESDVGAALDLHHPSAYTFLNQSGGCYTVEGVNDQMEFSKVLAAMSDLGIEDDEIKQVWQCLAAVLLVGNLSFVSTDRKGEPGCDVSDVAELARVAELWQVEPAALRSTLCRRSIEVRGEKSIVLLRPNEAVDGCAAAAKHVYGALFAHIVKRINESLDGERGLNVGVLDIFGFEIFDHNSFEQLCINYANEKLQQLFCLHTFKQEEALYSSEGIPHEAVEFIDNQPVLNLIEGRPSGLLKVLDDEAFVGPQGSEEQFMRNVDRAHKTNDLLHICTLQDKLHHKWPNPGFVVTHYAGKVVYDVHGFLEKNKDPVSPDLTDMLIGSKGSLSKALFADKYESQFTGPGGNTGYGMNVRKPTHRTSLGGQFRSQLVSLMDTLSATDPHFIRCVKPNTVKKPRLYDAPMCLSQLHYAGVFEAVAIRRSGFPFRMSIDRFLHWYHPLLLPVTNEGYTNELHFKPTPWASTDKSERVRQILRHTRQHTLIEEVQVGKTLVLYRSDEMRLLELLRSLALQRLVPYLQRMIRGALARECKRRCLASAANIREALQSACSVAECDAAAMAHGKLLGPHVKLFAPKLTEMRELRKLRNAFGEWVKLERELEAALAKFALSEGGEDEDEAFLAVESALLHAEKLRGVVKCTPFQQEIYEHARKIVDANAAARLTPQAEEALWLLDKKRMQEVVAEADRVKWSNADLDDIRYHLTLPEEKLVELQLKRANEMKDPQRVQNREVRLRDLYVTKFIRLFAPLSYPRLRSPMEWAAAKSSGLLAKAITKQSAIESLAAQMMEHTSKPIHLSLTEMDDAKLAREAINVHKAILAWAGERPDPHPTAQGLVVVEHAVSSQQLRAEIYAQLMKQLSPGAGSNEARQKYWDLMAICLLAAPPGTGSEDFVHAFAYNHAPDKVMRKRLIQQVHKGRYGDGILKELPTHDKLNTTARAFFGMGNRSSTRFSAADLITASSVAAAAAKAAANQRISQREEFSGGGKLTPPSMDERTPDIS